MTRLGLRDDPAVQFGGLLLGRVHAGGAHAPILCAVSLPGDGLLAGGDRRVAGSGCHGTVMSVSRRGHSAALDCGPWPGVPRAIPEFPPMTRRSDAARPRQVPTE
jgi:hypothetical protein